MKLVKAIMICHFLSGVRNPGNYEITHPFFVLQSYYQIKL